MLTQANFATVSTGVTIASGTPQGTAITFDVVLNNGTYDIHTTTITKAYDAPTLISEDASNLNNWFVSNGGWTVTNSTGYNDSSSITDFPSSTTGAGEPMLTLLTPIDLSGVQSPVLEYYTKWDIARLFDFMQIEIYDGSTWTELCGTYTKPGTSPNNVWGGFAPDQPTGEGLYDGFQKEWVREEIDLSAYAGLSSLFIRFIADDDQPSQLDGFFFDDFKIYNGDAQTCAAVDLDIRFDGFPTQTSWDITDANGLTVASGDGNGATASSNVIENACLPDGCYTLNFYDAVNNGMCPFLATATSSGTFITPGTLITSGSVVASLGSVISPGLCGAYTLYDTDGTVLATGGGGFGAAEANTFCLSGGVANFIHDDNEAFYARQNAESFGIISSMEVFPTLTKNEVTVRYSLDNQSRNSEQEVKFDASDLPSGLYFVQLISEESVIVRKFVRQ